MSASQPRPEPSVSRLAIMWYNRSSGRNSRNSLPDYPDVKVEIAIDYGLIDIVAERFDAGVRLGEQVMKVRRKLSGIAVRVFGALRCAGVL
jgi:DNA-binding transcriptional LysR family regulator